MAPVPWAFHVDFERRDESEMKLELAQLVSAWPLGVSLAATAALRGLRSGRRRMALNEALHELRRPLQALALSTPGAQPASTIQGSVRSAASALERLEREINGEPWRPARVPISARPLLEAAVGRWRVRAAMAGDSLALRWQAGEAIVEGDRGELAQALDNLIVNAIEHGGPEVVVEASSRAGRVRIAVIDRGREPGLEVSGEEAGGLLARLSGRRRHGHGLRVVRRVAAGHGGDFRLRRSERETEAVLELPLAGDGWGAAR
jgi:signal transduction histidine kinase